MMYVCGELFQSSGYVKSFLVVCVCGERFLHPALGRGVLQQQQPGMRTPVCGGCQAPIRCLFRLFCILIDGISYYARHLSGVALDYFVS